MEYKTIFVVDDSDTNLSRAEEALEACYEVLTVPSGEKMFKLLERVFPDLIILDINMPGMNGFEVLSRLKSTEQYKHIPVIFLTGLMDADAEAKGFEMGVVDFIQKPFSAPVLLNRVRSQINVNELIKERTEQLEQAHRDLIFILSDVIENRDKATGGHIERTTMYIKLLVSEMIKQGVYADELITWDIKMVSDCAILHDIGKIGISDMILNKPSALTFDELEIIMGHVTIGADIIDKIMSRTGEDIFLKTAKLFAKYHHEKWDGSGYAQGISGTDIPIHGRIMAVADVYDALVSARPYKRSYTHNEAVQIIMDQGGTHFDPSITKVFFTITDKFEEVSSGKSYV